MNIRIPKPVGFWTARKLEYLDHYLQAYRNVTKTAFQAHYIDLFAGCGDCVLKATGWPVEGLPWRALRAIPAFTRYFFVEKDPDLATHLRNRISEAGIKNAEVFVGDCNGPLLGELLSSVPRHALSFAFLDPSGLQLHWSTVERLASHRLGRWKMELLILYPYDMVIKRWINQPGFANALTASHGGEGWREAQSESERLQEDSHARHRRFVDLYKSELKDLGYRYVDDYGPMGYGKRAYYDVVFASDQPIGQKIMRAVWSRDRLIPGGLGYQPVRRPMKP
jgi:three-Cys-motif partner protein